jgi:hypothetical protein
VRFFQSGDEKWRVSQGGGTKARWSGDGTELFFLAPDNGLMVVPIESSGPILRFGTPKKLFVTKPAGTAEGGQRFTYDVAPDG